LLSPSALLPVSAVSSAKQPYRQIETEDEEEWLLTQLHFRSREFLKESVMKYKRDALRNFIETLHKYCFVGVGIVDAGDQS
jgi:hypothetical protein